jgi:iron complex outermembrane recepter protein
MPANKNHLQDPWNSGSIEVEQKPVSNSRRRSLRLCGLVAGASLLAAAGARAQTAAQPASGPASPDSPGTVAADAPNVSAPSSGNIEEITVTARRREENLQDVPVAISVLRGDDLDAKGVDSIQQLQLEVPSTTVFLTNPRQAQVAIRGLGANPAANGLSSSVGIYIDGVYLDRPGMAAYDLFDLQQTEVLRGPQGTLFGKNTTAGALNITTNRPSFTPEAQLEGTFGGYATQEYKAVLNGPIPGTNGMLAGRLSAYDDVHDGYFTALNGGSYNDLDRQGVRGELLFKPNADFELLLRGNYDVEHDHNGANLMYSAGATWPGTRQGIVDFQQWTKNAGINPVIGPGQFLTDSNVLQHLLTQGTAFSAEANYKFGDGYTLTSISAYRQWLFQPYNNGFNTASTPAALASQTYSSQVIGNDKQLSEELRVASPVGGPIDYVAGGYFFWRRMNSSSQVFYPSDWSTVTGQASAAYLNGGFTKTDGDPNTHSYAAFGQANWHIDDQFTLTGGLRETFEENQTNLLRYPVVGPNAALAPASQGPYNSALRIANWNLAELLTLSYKPQENFLTYLSLSHGAKAGGFNSPQVPAYDKATKSFVDVQSLLVYPETAYNAELGIKTSWLNKHLTVNVDGFFTRIKDYQANAQRREPDGTIIGGIQNVGAIQSKGFEAEATWLPVPGLQISGSGAYDYAAYQSFPNAIAVQGSTAATQDLSGARVVSAPRWTGNLSTTYTKPVTDEIAAYISAEYAYKSGQYGNYDDSSYSWIKPYGIANFRIGANIDEHYDISGFITNAFNSAYYYSVSTLSQGGGYTTVPIAPRIIGVTLRAKW